MGAMEELDRMQWEAIEKVGNGSRRYFIWTITALLSAIIAIYGAVWAQTNRVTDMVASGMVKVEDAIQENGREIRGLSVAQARTDERLKGVERHLNIPNNR